MASDPGVRLVLDSMSAVTSSLMVKVNPPSSSWALPRSSAGFDKNLGLFLYPDPLEQVPQLRVSGTCVERGTVCFCLISV